MKKITATIWIALFTLSSLTGCFRQDIVTIEYAIPEMQKKEDRQQILNAIDRLENDAIVRVALDIEKQRASITYDSTRLARKNIEHVIRDAGYVAEELPAQR